MRRLIILTVLQLIIFMNSGCLDDIEEVELTLPVEDIPVPTGLIAQVGDGTVTLSWESLEDAETYRVYRAAAESHRPGRIAETADTFYVDGNVMNGQSYSYSVSIVQAQGLEGNRSDEITAVPSLYSIIINGGEKYAGSNQVTLSLTAPATTAVMRISNNPSFSEAVWETFINPKVWSLEDGDGAKIVYAIFMDDNGSVSPVVNDSIHLDTYARITDISFPVSPRSPGSTVLFSMYVYGGENETGGEGRIRFEGFEEEAVLYDNGNDGDQTPGDGVYETLYRFPQNVRGLDLTVTGEFIDRAGNAALPFEAADKLSFTDPPDSVYLVGAQDSTTSSITIRWVASDDENFMHYRIYRDTLSGVKEEPRYLVTQLEDIYQTTYLDGNLIEGMTYHYRVYVVNDLMETSSSNERSASTFDAYPDPVTLDTLTAVGADRVTLTWSGNQNTDFKEYRIYRSTQPGVTTGSELIKAEGNREITYFDDTGLDLVTNTYYYRVYVFDRKDKGSRSNEVYTK